MDPIRSALSKTAPFAAGTAAVLSPAGVMPPGLALAALPAMAVGVAAASALAFGAFLATGTGRAILAEIRRRRRVVIPLPPAPSLRGAPSDAELAADCIAAPRTLIVRLRLGSRLADLEPTLDASTRYRVSKSGAKRIASRGPGFKGYLADHLIPLNYATLMRYKRLASRLRLLLRLDIRLPLEWLLPYAEASSPIPAALVRPRATARNRLQKLLRAHRNFSRLSKHVDAALGIPRLLAVRRSTTHRRRSNPKCPPAIAAAAWCINLEDTLVENTKREFALFLQSSGLPPKLESLRRQALDWLGTIQPPAPSPGPVSTRKESLGG